MLAVMIRLRSALLCNEKSPSVRLYDMYEDRKNPALQDRVNFALKSTIVYHLNNTVSRPYLGTTSGG